MTFTIEMNLSGVLLAGMWRTQDELNHMSTEDQRNLLIAELSKLTNQSVEHFKGFNNDTLVGRGAIVVFLRKAGIRDSDTLKNMTDDDQRNALISVNSEHTDKSVAQLQAMSNQELVQLGLVWLTKSLDGITSCGGAGEQSKKRWNDERHKKLIRNAVEIIQHAAPKVDVDAFNNKWWNKNEFQDAVFKGLKDADYVYPYDGFIFSSHFYDPDTKQNFWGMTNPTAMTETLSHFYNSLAKSCENKPLSEIGYELGLSLHYLTDLSQPMHAANYRNFIETLNFLHSKVEERFELNLDKYQVNIPKDRTYLDGQLKAAGSIENLVQSLSQKSKQIFKDSLKPFLKTTQKHWYVLFLKMLDDGLFDTPLIESIGNGEIAAAAFLLSWSRGEDQLIAGVYARLIKSAPEARATEIYRELFTKEHKTVRELVRRVGGSDGYYGKFVKGKGFIHTTQLLFRDFLDRELPPDYKYSSTTTSVDTWRKSVNETVESDEYIKRFGNFRIPGPDPISESRRRRGI